MYYNNSSFPIYLYKFNNGILTETYDIKKLHFLINEKKLENDFLKNINNKEKQDLFGNLTATLPSIIFSKIKPFTFADFKLKSIINDVEIKRIANIRIDIQAINEKLVEMENDSMCVIIKKDIIINNLIIFIFQYVFIELSKNIVATVIEGKNYYFDIKKDSKKFNNFINKTSTTTPDRIDSQKKFIDGFITSFDTSDLDKIKAITEDLIFMSSQTNQKKRLNDIFETNIILKEKISNTQKNKYFKYFFKNITAKFFCELLNDNSIDDYEVSSNFRTFLKRVQK